MRVLALQTASRTTAVHNGANKLMATSFDDELGTIVEQVAQEKGIDPKVLIETMEAAILKAAQAAFGPSRDLEARFNDETGSIDLFQYMTVVTDVDEPERQISIGDVRKHGLEADVGEELGFQVFWHPLDNDTASNENNALAQLLALQL